MFIGTAARLSGTTIKSIRHYEAIGLLPPPRREGKYRVYDQQTIERLTCIKGVQQLGFRLKEMQAILEGHQEQARQAIAAKKQELSEQIKQLQSMHNGLLAFEQSLMP